MPLPKSTKYRVKETKSGKKIRLAFSPSGKVIEAVKLSKKNKKLIKKKR